MSTRRTRVTRPATQKLNEARALHVMEGSGVGVERIRESGANSLRFHLVHPSGTKSLCEEVDCTEFADGYRTDVRARYERVCRKCTDRTERAYGERMTRKQVAERFNEIIQQFPSGRREAMAAGE